MLQHYGKWSIWASLRRWHKERLEGGEQVRHADVWGWDVPPPVSDQPLQSQWSEHI